MSFFFFVIIHVKLLKLFSLSHSFKSSSIVNYLFDSPVHLNFTMWANFFIGKLWTSSSWMKAFSIRHWQYSLLSGSTGSMLWFHLLSVFHLRLITHTLSMIDVVLLVVLVINNSEECKNKLKTKQHHGYRIVLNT